MVRSFNNMENVFTVEELQSLGFKYIEDCIEQAYNVIKKRTGKMVNGVFVKDN